MLKSLLATREFSEEDMTLRGEEELAVAAFALACALAVLGITAASPALIPVLVKDEPLVGLAP